MGKSSKPILGMILKGFPRISETFISNEIMLLEEMGFKIHLFSMRKPRESFHHRSVDKIQAKVDYLPETILAHLPSLLGANFSLALCKPRCYGKALLIALRRFMRTRKSATFKHLLQAGLVVKRLLPQSKVTHLHAHFAHSPTSVAMFTSFLSGLPFSFTAHAKDIYTSHPDQLAEKISLARFVVTCTEYNRNYLNQLAGRSRTPIYRIYHGIDLSLFNGDKSSRLPAPPYRVLTIARLTAKKGIPTVLAAIRKLVDQGFNVRHTLIGDGDDRKSILALIKTLGLEENSHWLGTLPHHEVLLQYQQADLFVLGCEVASNGDRDGIPNVLAESMAMRVPVVVTNVSAISELVEDGLTGLLVPAGEPEQMAAAMERLLKDNALRTRIISAAKERVNKVFDNKRLVGSLAAVYNQYL
ncbi:MAG: glycosyltransferase family 4 protein [Desulfobacteraceae bacterium]|jgi:glycosyltransferase involved in cell wall biosynthesis